MKKFLICILALALFLGGCSTTPREPGNDSSNGTKGSMEETSGSVGSETDQIPLIESGKPLFVIVQTAGNEDSAGYVSSVLQTKTGVRFDIVNYGADLKGRHGIYVGFADSDPVMSGIYQANGVNGYSDSGAFYANGDVYLYGYTANGVSDACTRFLSKLLLSYVSRDEQNRVKAYITMGMMFRSNSNAAYPISAPMLLGAPLKEYRIVISSGIKSGDAELLGYLRDWIGTQTGVYLFIVKDSEPAHNYEITIGATNRAGSAGAVSELLNYTVSSAGTHVAVGYGGKMALWAAVHDLIGEIEKGKADTLNLSAKATESHFTSLPAVRTENTAFRVISANALGPNGSDPSSTNFTPQMRGEILSEYILALDPDSIGFQECQSQNRSVIADEIGSQYAFVTFDHIGGGSWIATAYNKDRFTLEEQGWIELDPNGFGATYVFTWVLLKSKTDGSTYIHGNLHYHYRDTATRVTEAKKVNAELKRLMEMYPDVPMIVTGDYNSRVDSEEMSAMIDGTPFLDATQAAPAGCADVNFSSTHTVGVYTSPQTGRNSQIDHVTVNTNTTTVGLHRIIHDDLICYESDHYPILVDFSADAGTT